MLHFVLNNGLKIPVIGFGTYKASQEAMSLAVVAGYRYFDTASFYGNECMLGEILRNSRIPREDFIIASKLWKTDMGYTATKNALNLTLENIGINYIDVYMIHWPRPDLIRDDWKELDLKTWRAMEELYSEGKIRALGLSNFLPYHAENIIANCEVMPSVAQIEFHAGHTQTFALNYYREKNIQVQAWSPTARGRILNDELIVELAEKYSVSPVQICLAFCVNEGVMPLPKASSTERLLANLEAANLKLDREDIMRIENMPPLGWGGEHPDRERIKIV